MDDLTQTKRKARISIASCLLARLRNQRVAAHCHPVDSQTIQSLLPIEDVRLVNGDIVDNNVEANFGYCRNSPVVRTLQPTTDVTNANLHAAGGRLQANPITAIGALEVAGAKPTLPA